MDCETGQGSGRDGWSQIQGEPRRKPVLDWVGGLASDGITMLTTLNLNSCCLSTIFLIQSDGTQIFWVNKMVIPNEVHFNPVHDVGKFKGEWILMRGTVPPWFNSFIYVFFFFFLGNHRLLLSKHRKGDARRSLALHHHRGQHVSSFWVSRPWCLKVSLARLLVYYNNNNNNNIGPFLTLKAQMCIYIF